MRIQRTFTFMAVIIAILFLGIGYAAISNVTLNVSGTANVTSSNDDFHVGFVTTHSIGTSNATGAYSTETAATMTVNLDSTKSTGYAIFKVKNSSSSLYAGLSSAILNNFSSENSSYLEITENSFYTNEACTTAFSGSLAPQGEAFLKVTVHLKKVPLNDISNASFKVTVTATPSES